MCYSPRRPLFSVRPASLVRLCAALESLGNYIAQTHLQRVIRNPQETRRRLII